MRSIAVYLVERRYGGPEEGGWWYDAGTRVDDAKWFRLGETAASDEEARGAAARIQAGLDRDWNVGDHAGPLDSVLSAGRYEAHWFEGWPPPVFPAERPAYA